jgi:hypothetical protein
VQQVVGQGQGLIEIGRRESRLNSEKAIWSLAQVAEQGITRSRSHTLTKELFAYSRLHIQWMHRSAHDCIFGDTGESVAPWISVTDDRELRAKTVKCLLWLAEHSPMVGIWETERPGGFLETRLDDLIQDVIPLTTFDEGHKIVGKLQELIVSSFPSANRLSCRKQLQELGINEFQILIELDPLLSFWQGILHSGRFGYIDQLVDESFAVVVCSRLTWFDFAAYEPDDFWICRLLDCISRHLQPWPEQRMVSADFLCNRQFGFRETFEYISVNGRRMSTNFPCRIVLSWLGSNNLDQADTMHNLAGFKCGVAPPGSSWLRMSALLEQRNVWRGPQAIDENRQLVPLQFLLPNSAFMHWWASYQPLKASVPDAPLSSFRIICAHRKMRIDVSQIHQQQLVFQPAVVAMFDLSLSQRHAYYHKDHTGHQHPHILPVIYTPSQRVST